MMFNNLNAKEIGYKIKKFIIIFIILIFYFYSWMKESKSLYKKLVKRILKIIKEANTDNTGIDNNSSNNNSTINKKRTRKRDWMNQTNAKFNREF